MSINSVTSLRAKLAQNLLQAVPRLQQTGRSRLAKGRSGAGPAFVLGGKSTNLTTGLYSSLGAMLNSRSAGSGNPGSVPSAADKKRIETLKASAARIDAGNPQSGRKLAQQLLAKNADDVTAIRLVAHSYLAQRDYKQAERFYSRAAGLKPDNGRIRSDLSNVRTLQKNDDEVLRQARRILKSPERRVEGLRLLLRLADRSPNNAKAYVALADGFSAARKPLQVFGALQEAVRLADREQIGEVITRAEKLVQRHPQVGSTRNLLGRALQKAGRLDEAVAELKAAANVAPKTLAYAKDLSSAYAARARARLNAGNIDAARIDLQAARTIDPANTELGEVASRLAAGRAERAVARGRYSQALTELRKAAWRAPDDARFKAKVAALYARVGAHFQDENSDSLALISFQKALELDPDLAVAQRNVGKISYQKGLSAINAGDYDTAITHLEGANQAVRSDLLYRQDLARAYDLRGQRQVDRGKITEAIEDYKKALALDPTNSSISSNYSAAVVLKNGA